ncbi:MAG: chromosome segregation protein SMC [Faecalibacterium sp.]
MVLKELEIQGFKSFPDKMKIKIDGGITAVVGPNGSGKSNISDAIRWVLGETSAKQLRGAGKMENVIFGGTQLRGAMGFASVRLTLENPERTLDIDTDEVIIGRKYYRSGDSEYSINGQNCRLKDIYELFLDTGIGRDGYSIIGQGRIAEIVGAKSGERREIFEEASGIAKYRYRKNEAERRLASAEENLERLRDILGELESRVGPLERESEKAVKFLSLAEQRKNLEITLWVANIRKAKDTVRDQQRKFETAEADYLRFDAEQKQADEQAENLRLEEQRLTMEIDRLNAEIRSMTEERSGRESRIAVLQNDMQHNLQNIETLVAQREAGRQSEGDVAAQRQAHLAAIAEITTQCEALSAEIDHANEVLEKMQADSARSGERRGIAAGELAALSQRQTDCRVDAAAASSAVESATQQQAVLAQSTAETAAALTALQAEQAENGSYLATLTENLTRLSNMKNGIEMKLNARRQSLDEADVTEQKVVRSLDAAAQRIGLLRDLEKNMDGYGQSVKAVMRAANNHRLRGIIGPVSSIVSVEKGYEVAIETALGAALQNIVVENQGAAKAAMAFLKEERAGRATFLPLDTIQAGYFNGQLTGSAQLASELVRCDARFDTIISSLLGRIVVVDDINEASSVAKRLNYRNRIVTVDGQVINAGGSFTGGSVQRSAGLFTRKQEIDDLKVQIVKLQKDQAAAQENTDRWKAQVDALSAELTATGSEEIVANNDKIRADMEQNRINSALAQLEENAQRLETQRTQLAQVCEAGSARAAECAAEEARLTAEIETLSAEITALSAGDDTFLATRSRLGDALGEKKLARLACEKDIEQHQAAMEALQGRSEESTTREAAIAADIARLEQLNTESEAQIAAVGQSKEDSETQIAACEASILTARQSRMEKEGEGHKANALSRAIAEDRERMSGEMARLSERKVAAESEYDKTIAKLWDEYQLSLTEGEKLCVEFESISMLQVQVTDVRNKIRGLGHVNVGAIEEFKEVKARFDVLSTQVGDVEQSKAELLKMIGALSGQMQEIFSENFKIINANFSRIFRELFGGGSASLTLDDETSVLESGIEIHVAPPGKVIKNLSALSGGEQSLVAISIYFAILAVNPAPFCILDEIEAALDDSNVVRYAQYLKRISDKSQFIVITHRRGTMEAADVLYGVTMQDDGVSKLLRLNVDEVDATLVS